MALSPERSDLRYSGYRRDPAVHIDDYLVRVGRGTPGGEYHRRFWQAVAYEYELGDVPLRTRVLGEDVVVFRDRSGQFGVLQLHCCHRNASLEFGLIEERGLRCCYHGRLFDVDGTILEMPGEPDRMKQTISQGAYPTHRWGGIVFVYMGPLEKLPVFPTFDFMTIPMRLEPGKRWEVECNWLQMRENTMDPAHTYTLHAIPQWRGMEHFAPSFGSRPTTIFTQTRNGFMYTAARKIGDKVWIRSADTMGPNMKRVGNIFEDAQQLRDFAYPFLTVWTTPMDDEHSVTLYVSHVGENEKKPFAERRALEDFGQYNDRPYRERQWIPGDYDAQVGQGPITSSKQHLVSQDRGVVLFRRRIREEIAMVERGEDPGCLYYEDPGVVASYTNDRVVPASAVEGDPDDPAVLAALSETVAQTYLEHPPLAPIVPELRGEERSGVAS